MEEIQDDSISLGQGLHARSRLVEYQWSWKRWGISLELHGRTWSMTWRELGPQSQWLPLVTHYTVMDSNPAACARSPCSSQQKSRPVWSLPKTIWMIQRRHGRRSCGYVWRKKDEYNPKNTIPTVKHRGGNTMFGGAFLKRGWDNCTVLRGWWMGPCIVRFWPTTSSPQ